MGGGSGAGGAGGAGVGHHPYAANPPAPTPVIAQETNEPDEVCPVCLESLSFSFRLPGEKPHIVPECGHALHEVSLSSNCLIRVACGVLGTHTHTDCVLSV